MIRLPKTIDVYSDGSGNTMNSDGGWGYRIIVDGELKQEGSGYLKVATNNIAEVSAATEGLKAAAKYIQDNNIDQYEVTLVSDSQLTLFWAIGRYKCKKDHLKPYVEELIKSRNTLTAAIKWVKGHSGDEHNEATDQLAKAARAKGAQ